MSVSTRAGDAIIELGMRTAEMNAVKKRGLR